MGRWILGLGLALLLAGCQTLSGPSPAGVVRPAAAPRSATTPAPAADFLYTYRAVVRRVIDGDTIVADIDLGLHVWVHGEHLRLARINAPEIKGAERPRGLAARDWLRRRIEGRTVLIRTLPRRDGTDRKGKYGRYLVEVFQDGVNLNDELVRQGLAVYRDY